MQIVAPPNEWRSLPSELPCLEVYRREPRGRICRLIAVGDIGLTERVRACAGGYEHCFAAVQSFLSEADLVFGNMEYTVLPDETGMGLFAGGPESVGVLRRAGFNLVSIANNHCYDYGADGLAASLAALETEGIVPLGTSDNRTRLVRTDRDGLRIGWLACGRSSFHQDPDRQGFWEFDRSELLAAVARHRTEVDVLAVSIHTGYMYLDYPDPAFKAYAGELAQAGAALVLVHHAHVLQGIEITAGGSLICYNLGNFLLDWMEGHVAFRLMVKEQNESGLFCFDLDRDGICAANVLPILIENRSRVVWAQGERGRRILERLRRISNRLGGRYGTAFRLQRITRNATLSLKVVLTHLLRGHFRIAWTYIAARLLPQRR